MLKIENLGRAFGRNIAVDGVSTTIRDGQMVGLIGPAAAGKSTLLRLLGRLVDPTQGRILCDEVDIAAITGRGLRDWRADCVMMAAQHNLVGQTSVMAHVLAGLLVGMPHWRSKTRIFTMRERGLALQALERVGMAHVAHQQAALLSRVGQKRVAIARALVQKPKLLLADDPVAQMGAAEAAEVMGALCKLNRQDGMTVICAFADVGLARASCERIIGLRAGRIMFDGAPDQLGPDALRAIYGTPADALSVMPAIPEMVDAA